MFRVYILISFTSITISAAAQDRAIHDSRTPQSGQLEISRDEAVRMADKSPTFAVYRDNYFVTDIPSNKRVNNQSADAAFQISIRHRITKSILPLNTFACLTYTQKSFWDIYTKSSPFRDTNYNPGVGLGKYISRNNRLVGAAFIQIMHESNGRDGEDSRSWNYLSLSAKYFVHPRLCISGELWLPYTQFGKNSKELIDYKGHGRLSLDFITSQNKWWLSADILPRKGLTNVNTTLTAAYWISKRSNQYLFTRFFQGYAESQKDFSKYVINIRIGICIKPDFYSMF